MSVLFIIMIVILWALAIFFLVMTLMRLIGDKRKKLISSTGRILKKLSKDEDFILLEKIKLNLDDGTNLYTDYFLIADKFCYLIYCKKYDGVSVEGELEDDKWLLTLSSGQNVEVPNLIKNNELRVNMIENWIKDYNYSQDKILLPIVVIDNELAIDPKLVGDHNGNYLFRVKYLKNGIENIEKTSNMKDFTLEAVQIIYDKIKPFSSNQ